MTASSPEILSVSEAAQLLDVGVSTLKRWADSGTIESFRTAGGHRRFDRDAVERFRIRRMEGGPGPGWLALLKDEADLHVVASELLRARARLGSWWSVADELGHVLEELGARWERGEMSVIEEHVASERLARGLAWCAQSIPLPTDPPAALLAMAEGDDHTLGLSLAELTLREAGWHTRWAGRRTPLGDLVNAIHHREVGLIALSASCISRDAEALRELHAVLAPAARLAGVVVVLGGEGAWPDPPSYGHRLRSFEELHRLLGSLAREAA